MSRCPNTGVCSSEDHEATKADLTAFRALPLKAAQTIDLGDGESVSLEHRNCHCTSTLTRYCTADEVVTLNAAIAISRAPTPTEIAFDILRREGHL